ncbi:MAG: 2-amino-4-hydroxy-6-hydroxymethyldihydropteridine diphosphokinase [Planctomycetota bacterium]|jgi:2-amino-4-hydroxy-6-hydroxymethyldihydropteridine diphosphokinase
MTRAALGLGSNLGDRRAHIEGALRTLEGRVKVVAVSRLTETEPEGGPEQGPYLNGAAVVETELGARGLLDLARELEDDAGRVRSVRWGPRTLDVDLLLFGDAIIDEPGLMVPHPRMGERLFVLEPLAEIAPDWPVPGLHRTVGELREELSVHP